jgi:mannose-1-phosphate guanylyltransferase
MMVCNEEHRFMVAEQLRAVDIRPAEVSGVRQSQYRTSGRDCGAARSECRRRPLLLILLADHIIADVEGFCTVVR